MELRERLNSLKKSRPQPVGASTAADARTQSPLLNLIPLENEKGLTYYTDKIYIEPHGQIDPKHFPEIAPDTLRFLSLDHSLHQFDVRQVLFLDIETTGTAGGTGTYAFLVGLGFLEEGYFQVRQFFLHDLSQEAAFLHAVAEFCGRFPYLITYNGKCFDAQILRNRYLMHRWEDPLIEKKHIDMLFIARRLWKIRFRDCDLMNLERNVLGFHRVDDIPSYLIPSAYTDYLRFANASLIQKVIHHNQWDILSLAVLTARASLLQTQKRDLSAEEHFSLSLLYERQKDFERAIEHQTMALQTGSGLERSIWLALARNLRRIKDHARMQWLLQQVQIDSLNAELCRQLCIICEHDLKDHQLALELAEAEIRKLERFRGIATNFNSSVEEWNHRRNRLMKKNQRNTDRT